MHSGVVVGYDETSIGERALVEAAAEADRRGVALTVVHALHRTPLLAVASIVSSALRPSDKPADKASDEPSEEGSETAPDEPDEPDEPAEPDDPAEAAEAAEAAEPSGRSTAESSFHDTAEHHIAEHQIAEHGADRVRAQHPGLTVEARTVAGPVPAVLADQSSEADLLVVGHQGRGAFGRRFGPVALRTVARAVCPAMVVRGSEHRTRGTVLAAVDVGHGAEEVLEVAFAEAAMRGARLKAVSALNAFWPRVYAGDGGQLGRASGQAAERAQDALRQVLEPWPARYPGVVTDHEIIQGMPEAFITGATTYADLIVVGASARHFGAIAETLLRHSDCPVTVVPYD